MNTIKWLMTVLVLGLCSCDSADPLNPTDLDAIKSAQRQYAVAWLTNNPDEVMNTLTNEPILVPSGMSAIEGQQAARNFWWPEGSPPVRVTRFDMNQEDVGGHGDLAYVRGTFLLEFEYEAQVSQNRGEYVSILERGDRGWKISTHMWNDAR